MQKALGMHKVLRSDCYMVNFCDTMLPDNDAKILVHKDSYHHMWNALVDRLKARINGYHGSTVLVAGATALHALFPGYQISTHRGSPLRHEDLPGKYIIPMYHPAFCLPGRMPQHFYTEVFDIGKAIRINEQGITPVAFEQHIEPCFDDAYYILERIATNCAETTLDIEMVNDQLSVVGLSVGSYQEVIAVPFFDNNGRYWSLEQELKIWKQIGRCLENPNIRKIGQNIMFDVSALYHLMQVKTNNIYFDTMIAQHVSWTDLPKGLDYLVSIYTDEPYYKDENKDWKNVSNFRQHWAYNCKDVAYTHYIMPKLWDEVRDLGNERTFQHSMELHKPLLEMMTRGTRCDVDLKDSIKDQLDSAISLMEVELRKLVGNPTINFNSPKQLCEFFYETCGVKPYTKQSGKGYTIDANALKKIAQGKHILAATTAALLLKMRKLTKQSGTYFGAKIGRDMRFRCFFKIAGTETGRLASAKFLFNFGTNMQNLPGAFKKVLKADFMMIQAEADLSQAESRVVAGESEDTNMRMTYEQKLDAHVFNASMIFDVPYDIFYEEYIAGDPLRKDQRQMGKKIVHASNYLMGARTMAMFLGCSVSHAAMLAAKYNAKFPSLKRWQKDVQNEVKRTRIMVNLFGRKKRFLGFMDDSLFREATAYVPQSTVGQCMTEGLVEFSLDRAYYQHQVQLLSTVHDSVLVQFPIPVGTHEQMVASIVETLQMLDKTFTKTLVSKGYTYQIPCDFKIGFAWGTLREVKQITAPVISTALRAALSDNLPATMGVGQWATEPAVIG